MTVSKTFYPSALGARQQFAPNNAYALNIADGLCAQTGILGGGATKYIDVLTFLDSGGVSIHDAIPEGSTLLHTYIGIKGGRSVALNASLTSNFVFGGNIFSIDATYSSCATSLEQEIEADRFHLTITLDALRNETFICYGKAVNASAYLCTYYIDEIFIRIEYDPPVVPESGGSCQVSDTFSLFCVIVEWLKRKARRKRFLFVILG